METELNTLQNSYKIYNFTITVFSIAATVYYAVQDDRGRPLPAMRSIKQVVCNFTESRVFCMYVCLFVRLRISPPRIKLAA